MYVVAGIGDPDMLDGISREPAIPACWISISRIADPASGGAHLGRDRRSRLQLRTVDSPALVVTILALMRFPLALTTKIAAYIINQKLRRTPKFATVLQLEPLHTCNLTCTGCGRIREYSTSLKDILPLEDCLSAAAKCNAPLVSICGGEP